MTAILAIAVIMCFLIDNPEFFKRSAATDTVNGNASVHFIDVGQGDSILIQSDGKNVLIDAGENNKGDDVLSYLETCGIQSLDYVIGTHAHSDHIGGLDTVINSIEVKNVLLYDLPEKHIPSTKTYIDVLKAIDNNNVNLISAKAGEEISLGDGVIEILGPVSEKFSDLNDFSIVCRFTFGEKSFLFMGDSEIAAEIDLINHGTNLSADVLKAGHHGSRYSCCDEFLDEVNPSVAVMSVGKANSYDHPHDETINKLTQRGVEILRTDFLGNIVITTNGKKLKISKEK